MVRSKLVLAMVLSAGIAATAFEYAEAAPKPAAAPAKNGWTASEAPAVIYDPAYAAYDMEQYETAFKLATEAAGKGEVQAYTLLGMMYENGLGVKSDGVRAAEWYTKAATAGDMHGQFRLGLMLAKGRSVKKDEKKAADFFEAAAGQGHTLAAYNLAQVYIQGWARPQDSQKAAYWLEQAALKDHAQAAYDLAALYRNGEGVKADEAKAAEWLKKAADAGHADAQIEYALALGKVALGKAKRGDNEGSAKDLAASVKLFRVAAERGNAVAQNRLARAYSAGVGVPKDVVKAAMWHMLARRSGESDIKLDFLVMLLRPEERQKAEELARTWRDETWEVAR